MKPSRRKTLNFKTSACQYCGWADQARILQQRVNPCKCPTEVIIVNGHCEQRKPIKEATGG